MRSERVQRQIDRLLDQAEQALEQGDLALAREKAQLVLGMDAENRDALTYLAAVERAKDRAGTGSAHPAAMSPSSSPVSEMTPAQPGSFTGGRYEVKRFLGEGGKKKVYLAHDTLLDRDVAFALIKSEGLDDAGRQRIRREAQAMGRLGAHPHIVSVFDLGQEGEQPYIVTELMGGGDVEGLIDQAQEHRLDLARVLQIAQEVCQGLEFAHDKGIVHRDLKPGNVWLTTDGRAKIGDFGLAVAIDRSRLTQAGMMVGTVAYMPPEQAMGGEVTSRADLYSLGAMLYEMVCGRPPLVGDESVAIIGQHLNTPPVSPSWHRPELPPALEALILQLLEKDPAKRPASAADVGRVLVGLETAPTPQPRLPGLREGARSGGSPLSGLGEGPGVRADNPLYRQVFVGREAEVRQVQAAFDGVLAGRGALITVVGEPGIGKTALCEQLATYVALRGGRTLVGHAYEGGSLSLPYLAFVEALRTYVLARPPEALRDELGSGASDVARIVSEVRERVQVEPRPVGGDPEEERWRLLQAVVGFLRNASTVQPLLLVLEDLHWADRGTLDLLIHLARNLAGARLLVVGTYRDVEVDRAHPLSAALAELRRAGSFGRVLLRGLVADEVQRMMNGITGQEVRWSFAEAVHRQTEGNPLFVQEVLRYLVEEGHLAHEGGRWRRVGETPPEMHIPEGLRDVIGKRLSQLSLECNRVLAIAAVIGRDFELETLRRVADMPEETLIEALEEARRVAVLEERARVGIVRYRFAHAFFRQTLYEEMSAPRRLRLHQQVARALESQYSTRLEDHGAELAGHFAQSTDAEDLKKAVHYGEVAARRAVAVYAYGEAVRLLEQAVEVQGVLDQDDRSARCDLLLALGEALMPAGEPGRVAEEMAEEAFALAELLDDRARAARACQLAVEALARATGRVTSPAARRRWAERADRYAAPDSADRVYADLALVRIREAGRQAAEAEVLKERALALARRLGDPDTLYYAAGRSLLTAWSLREAESNIRLARECAAWPRAGVRAKVLGELLRNSGFVLLDWGERAQAEALWRELMDLAARTHDVDLSIRSLQPEVILATLDGRLEEALAAGARIVALGEETGSPDFARLFGVFQIVRPLLYLGRAEEALPVLGSSASDDVALGNRAVALAHLERRDEVQAILHEMIAERWAHRLDEAPVNCLANLLEAAVRVEDRDTARSLAGVLDPIAGLASASIACTCAARHLGAAAALLGDRAQARSYYGQALVVATKVRNRPEMALARLGLAELLLAGDGDQGPGVGEAGGASPTPDLRPVAPARTGALGHLDFAIDEFQAMKMQPALEQALRHKGLLHA